MSHPPADSAAFQAADDEELISCFTNLRSYIEQTFDDLLEDTLCRKRSVSLLDVHGYISRSLFQYGAQFEG